MDHSFRFRIASSFIVEEKECALFLDRTTDGTSIMVAEQDRTFEADTIVEEIVRGCDGVAMIPIQGSMVVVGSTARDEVDLRT